MNTENNSIHDFDFNLICEYFANLDRQGPGNDKATRKAASFIKGLTSASRIADLGCGTGTQTLTLARCTKGQIIAIDLFPTFIEKLNDRCKAVGLDHRIHGLVGDMKALPFPPDSLDLIWSEGAIYNIGFQRGIKEWQKYLKRGGHIAVSEASWLTTERPAEIEDFWADAYPEIDTISNKVAQMETAGCIVEATFVLPNECWTHAFYRPQKVVQRQFLQRHPNNPMVAGLIKNQQHEAELFELYHSYYGYVFYIGRKA